MSICRFYIALLLLALSGVVNAQMTGELQERKSMYDLVIGDFIASGSIEAGKGFGILDSTCPAEFYGGFPDSINQRYFGFESNNYIDGEVFRRNFVQATKTKEQVPADFLAQSGQIPMRREIFRSCFSTARQPEVVLSLKGFEKLAKLYATNSYCEFSIPYFVNEHTALIYFNYQDGLDNNFSNVYLLTRKEHIWSLTSRLRSWE